MSLILLIHTETKVQAWLDTIFCAVFQQMARIHKKKKKVIGDYICHKNTENGYEVFHHCKDCAPFWPLGETAEEGEDEDVEKTEEPEKEEPAEPEPPKGNSTVHPSLYSSLTLTAPPGVMFCDLNFNVGMLIFLCCLLFLEY